MYFFLVLLALSAISATYGQRQVELECVDRTSSCARLEKYCRSKYFSIFAQLFCPKTCGLCPTTTTKPRVQIFLLTKRLFQGNEVVVEDEEPKEEETKEGIKEAEEIGICADQESYCNLIANDTERFCGSYGHLCPYSCGRCKAESRESCSNFTDDNYRCSERNCEHDDLIQRHRILTRCASTCCNHRQLYGQTFDFINSQIM